MVSTASVLDPPAQVRGMTKWQPELFMKKVMLPHVDLPAPNIGKVKNILKKCKLKVPCMPNIREIDSDTKRVLLNPDSDDLTESDRQQIIEAFNGTFGQSEYELNIDNYSYAEAIKFVIPEDEEGVSATQIVGHITHINLRDHLLPYKQVIGEIILNSNPRTQLVVMKSNSIENKFRNLDLEIIAGDPKAGFEVLVKENGCSFKLDYSKVYWNPRLSTEHERIEKMVERGDVVFDIFAGIGPFAIPIAKKGQVSKKNPIGIEIFANDLNPDSVRYLKENLQLNKISNDKFHLFNLDGGDFIKQQFPSVLKEYFDQAKGYKSLHIIMNLPALAVTFLTHFRNLLSPQEFEKWSEFKASIWVHVYAFSREDEDLTKECCKHLQVDEISGLKVHYVRDVAPNKEMFRVTFPLKLDYLLQNPDETSSKKPKLA